MQSRSLTYFKSGGYQWVALHQDDKEPYPLRLPDLGETENACLLEWLNAVDSCFALLESLVDLRNQTIAELEARIQDLEAK